VAGIGLLLQTQAICLRLCALFWASLRSSSSLAPSCWPPSCFAALHDNSGSQSSTFLSPALANIEHDPVPQLCDSLVMWQYAFCARSFWHLHDVTELFPPFHHSTSILTRSSPEKMMGWPESCLDAGLARLVMPAEASAQAPCFAPLLSSPSRPCDAAALPNFVTCVSWACIMMNTWT